MRAFIYIIKAMKPYNPNQKFKSKRSTIAIIAVVALAVVLIATGLTIALVEKNVPQPEISSIEFVSDKLGAYANYDEVNVKVVFSDNSTKILRLSEFLPTGIDKSREGLQNIVLTYGNRQFTVAVEVVTTDVKINYVTSGEGGSIVGDLSQSVPAGMSGTEVEAIADDGFQFAGWSDGVASAIRKETDVSRDMTIRALFKKNSYIVTFMLADGTVREQTVQYGERAVPIADTDSALRKYGYRFDGWDTDEWKNVTKDVTVRPVLTPIRSAYDIYVSSLSGEPMGVKSITDTNVETDSLNGLNESHGFDRDSNYYLYKGYYQWGIPGAVSMQSEDGRVFDTWEIYGSIQEGGTASYWRLFPGSDVMLWLPGAKNAVLFTAASDEKDGVEIQNLKFTLAEGTALLNVRAVYAKKTSVVSFYTYGNLLGDRTVNLDFGTSLTEEQLRAPEQRQGYDFIGWFTERNEKITTAHAPFYVDTKLNAQYEAKDIRVTFVTSDGTVTKTAKYDQMLSNAEFPQIPEKVDYLANGWIVEGENTVFSAETKLTEDVRVVPNYRRITFDATFFKSGQGKIYYTEKDPRYGATEEERHGVEKELSNAYLEIKSGANYTFRFVAETAKGYSYQGFSFKGASEMTGASDTFTVENLKSGFSLTAEFVQLNRTVSVINGKDGVGGAVSILGQNYDAEEFEVQVLSGMPLELLVTAPKDMRISGIYLGTDPQNLLPDGVFDSYTYRYSNNGSDVVLTDLEIRIEYQMKEFEIRIPETVNGGRISFYVWNGAEFETVPKNARNALKLPFGSKLKLEISADQSKYIKKLQVWGKSVDFYQFYYDTFDSALFDNGNPYFFTDRTRKGFTEKDPRVTEITLYLSSPNATTDVQALFEDLYFNVSVASTGYGTVSLSADTVKEGGSVNLTMQTDPSYVIEGYTRVNRGETDEIVTPELGGNNSSLRETVANIITDVEIEVRFARRSYVVLFYNLPTSGISYTVGADGEFETVDADRSPNFTMLYGDSKTYRLTAENGYEFDEITLVNGYEQVLNTIKLPVNTDVYDLVVNRIAESCGVKVKLRKKTFEVKLTTNALSEQIGTVTLSDDQNTQTYQPSTGGAFSFEYGSVVTVAATAAKDFYLKSLKADGKSVSIGENATSAEIELTIDSGKTLEIIYAYNGTGTGIVVDDAVKEGEHTANGYVTFDMPTDTSTVVMFRAFADTGYVLKGLYSNGVLLKDDGYGEYPSAYDPNGIQYVTAVFEKKELTLTLNAENGKLSSEKDYVFYGETAEVWFVADTGYELASVRKNQRYLSAEEILEIKKTGILVLGKDDTTDSLGTVSVTAVFTPIAYTLNGIFDAAATGTGAVELENGNVAKESTSFDVFYGDRMTFRFVADEGSYIASITLNGVAVELNSMTDAVIKTSNGKYAVGRFDIVVTGDTDLSVRFDRDVFKVTVAETSGGSASLSPTSVMGNDEYSSDESITVSLNAISGYHISALYINGAAQPLNLQSADEPNLNTSVLYLIPRELLVQNLVVRAEFERNAYSVKLTVENESVNFKATDNSVDRFMDTVSLEYGGSSLTGEEENDRANSRYNVTYGGIEHTGAPRVTLKPRSTSGYLLKSVVLSYRNSEGIVETVNYTQNFGESNNYSMALPAMYWDITDFKVVVTRRTVNVTIPPTYRNEAGRTAIRIEPGFFAGSEEAVPSATQSGNTYVYEFGVRLDLTITVSEGFTPTRFLIKTSAADRNFLGDVVFRNGRGTYSATLADNTEFTFEAAVTVVTMTLSKIGSGDGTYNFLVNGTPRPNESVITVEYGTPVGLVVIADRAGGSHLSAIRIGGVSQPLGQPDAEGHYYEASLSGTAAVDSVYEIEFRILEYTFRTEMPEGVQGVTYNNDTVNIFPWGTERVSVRIELRQGYELTEISINGKALAEGDYISDGSLVTFNIIGISSNQNIVPSVRKKMFTVSNNDSSQADNKTEIYVLLDNGNYRKIENNVKNNISYGDRLFFVFRPAKDYYVESYTVTMRTLTGGTEERNGAVTYPEENNTDVIRVEAGLVTGDTFAEITYRQKLYTIEYRDDAGSLGIGEIKIGSTQIPGGSGVRISIQTKNLVSPNDASVVYYGVQNVRINGYDYFAEEVPFKGWGELHVKTYDAKKKTYYFEYDFIASDALMLGTDQKIGSGTDFTLKLEIVIEKNLYYMEEVVVRNMESGTAHDTVVKVENGSFRTDEFTGRFSDSIFDGSSDLLELNMTAAYSPVSLSVRTDYTDTETEIQKFSENAGTQTVMLTANATVADMSNPYRKTIRLVVVIDRNRYDSSFTVLTNEKNGQEVSIGQNVRGVTAKLNDKSATDEELSKISHGSTVVITAGEHIDYEFAGYETFDEQTATWIAATNVVIDGMTVVSIEGRELTISAVREFKYRAVYYKKVTVDIVLAPWHKYLSGNYVSGNGSELTYVNYASLIVTVGGAEKRYEIEQSKNDRGIFRYVFRYGDEALIEAKDEKSASNPSSKITFYLQNKGSEQVIQSVGSVSSGQMRFSATENYEYNEDVSSNEALYVAFGNQIKLNVGTETLGSADQKDGATITYQRKVSGANTSYTDLTLINGRTANVSMFDKIRITVSVTDGYRFESFSRYQAQRDSLNLTFLNSLETFARFNATGLDEWEVLTASGGDGTLVSDSRFSVRKEQNTVVIEFTVVDNSIYKFDFVKVYEANGFVSAPRYVGDDAPYNVPVQIEAENNKSYFVSDGSGVKGKIDYGATVTMKLEQSGDELFDETKWQFISWYANGVAVKSSGIRNFNYYDAYADERILLTEQYGFVSNAKTAMKFEFYAEFLPLYSVQSREHYNIDGTEFRPTSSFEMAGLYYDKSGAQVQIPQNAYAESVNLGDGSVVEKKYLPFDARKGGANGTGKPNSAEYANAISLNVINAVSYSIVSWRIYYGDYNPDNAAEGGASFAGNTQNVVFTMTEEIYRKMTENGQSAFRPVTIVPEFSKKNDFNVRKSVFYSNYGVPSQSGRSDNNPGVVYFSGNDEFINTDILSGGIMSVNYGEVVTLDANPNNAYRFIGWFDPNAPQDSTEPISAERRLVINANKTSNDDYTFYYEARYIRTVTLNLSSLNTSGSHVKESSANILKGNASEGGWLYQGIDVSERYGASQLKTFDVDDNGNAANLTADVGSYALFKLSGSANARGFDPAFDVFMQCAATSGLLNYTATKQGDGSWKVVVYMDQSKTVSAQYKTYGTVTLQGLLDQSEVTLGAEMSKNIYEYVKFEREREGMFGDVTTDDLMRYSFTDNEVTSASYDASAKRITVRLAGKNTTGRISIRSVMMADYQADVLTFAFNGFSSLTDEWAERLGLNFHGNNMSQKTVSATVQNMPFAGGAGTEQNPYRIANYAQFRNINTMYEKNASSLQGVYLLQTADITLDGSWIPMCLSGSGFNGNLNGNGRTIIVPNTLQTASNTATGGIFAKTGIGTIRNYTFKMGANQVRLSHTESNAGVVTGTASGTRFENFIFNDFNVVAYGKSFGLVAGSAEDSNVNTVQVKNLNLEYMKDDKGSVFGTAVNSVLEGIIFIREANSDSKFYFTSASSRIGGIVGSLSGQGSELKNSCIYGGNIRATGTVGGAVGLMTDGAKITGVGAVLEKTVTVGAMKVPQMLQVSAESVAASNPSTSINVNPQGESEASEYAAGGLVGVLSGSFASGLYILSRLTDMKHVSSPYGVYRNYPAVSVVGSVAGGLVGVSGMNSMISESYIESGASVEILMPSRSDVNADISTRNAGSDGIFGGLVASNFGTIYHCGINGATYNGKTGYDLDQVGGKTGNDTFNEWSFDTSGGSNNPFDSEEQSNKGLHLNASVEFLYAASVASGGRLQKAVQNNFYYGATYLRWHSTSNSYQGNEFAARGTSTTIMGGIAGYNGRGGVMNSDYVSGKVVHFRRLITESNGTLYSVLGGVVGFNANEVYNCGILNTAVYNFVKPVADNSNINITVSAGGVIGYSQVNYLRGLFSYKTAVRAVNDPYSERGSKRGGAGSGSSFYSLAAAIASNLNSAGVMSGYFCYGGSNKVSATQDTISIGVGTFYRVPSLGGINFAYTRATDFGGADYGTYVSGEFTSLIGKTVQIDGANVPATAYYSSDYTLWLLNQSFVSSGSKISYLGNKTGFVTLR